MAAKTPYEKYIENPLKADPGMNGYCGVKDCQDEPRQETPLCAKHSWDLWFQLNLVRDSYNPEATAAALRQAELEEGRDKVWADHNARWYKPDAPFTSKPGMIYYLEVGEHIKIGFSSNLESRLQSYPPNSKLLALHPGTIQTEQSILKKFKENLAMRKEWFDPSPDIYAHIESVHQQFPKQNKDLIH